MSKADERRKQQKLSTAYVKGEKLPGIRFRHNSQVSFRDTAGKTVEGWIVGVDPGKSIPIYNIERCDHLPDEEVAESNLTLLFDPHV